MWTLEEARKDYKESNKLIRRRNRKICANCKFGCARDSRNIDYVCEVLKMNTYAYIYGCKYFTKKENIDCILD